MEKRYKTKNIKYRRSDVFNVFILWLGQRAIPV